MKECIICRTEKKEFSDEHSQCMYFHILGDFLILIIFEQCDKRNPIFQKIGFLAILAKTHHYNQEYVVPEMNPLFCQLPLNLLSEIVEKSHSSNCNRQYYSSNVA